MPIIAIFALTTVIMAGACGGPSKNEAWTNITTPSNSAKASQSANDGKDMKDGFTANLPSDFTQPTDDAGRKLLKEYGAVFVARSGAVPPKVVFFMDEAAVSAFQAAAGSSRETVGGVAIELQDAAMKALKAAVVDAEKAGTTITPRGADAAKRSYQDTVGLWKSRVDPGFDHWVKQGRVTAAEAARIRSLSPFEQVPEIFKLESDGIYFAKDLSKSIIYSVAPPGSSQHLSMLALDVSENDNAEVRSILAQHGWFQTVVSDLPHFTFLGTKETDLPKLGLKKTTNGGRTFWVPDL